MASALQQQRTRTTWLLNLASIVERADEQVLPAIYLFIGASLHATPAQLGTLTLCRAMVQALSSPLSGLLADRLDRTHVVAFGCFLWGVMTAGIGMATTLHQAMVYCAFNGIGLALVIPCVQSLLADYTQAETRGHAFGVMYFTAALGGMAGGFFATNLGATSVAGVEGWRCAFHFIAALSVVTAALVAWLAVDPRLSLRGVIAPMSLGDAPPAKARMTDDGEAVFAGLKLPGAPSSATKRLQVEGAPLLQRDARSWAADIMSVMRIPTFQIVVLQGIVGTFPWQALVFFTMWLQLLGFSDLAAASLMAIFTLGCALGSLLGGRLGDECARRWPRTGRILAAQFSVACGLPLSLLLLKGLPTRHPDGMAALVPLYALVLAIFGLLITWCGSANSCIFADVVPVALRSTVYAFDRSFEGAVGACAAPLVGIIAERAFAFEGHLAEAALDADRAAANARALASALLLCLVVPWALCLLFYIGLHKTYQRDRQRASQHSEGKGMGARLGSQRQASFFGAAEHSGLGSGHDWLLQPRSGHSMT